MKKKISLFLAIVMLFSLVGCKKEQSDNSKEHIEVLKKVVVNDFENSADAIRAEVAAICNRLGNAVYVSNL